MRSFPSIPPERRNEALLLARDAWRRTVAIVRRTPGLLAISLLIGFALWVFVTDVENPTVVDTLPSPILVEAVNVGEDLAVANQLPAIQVQIAAPADRWERLTAANFRAFVDLRDFDARSQEVVVQVEVEGVTGVRVVETDPQTIVVNLEDLITAEVPVSARVIGTLPLGYELEEATPAVERVTVRGPESLVALVAEAVASVNVTGLTVGVDQTVPLQPQGAGGAEIRGVRLDPPSMRVSVDIVQRTLARTVPLTVEVVGEPDPGYRVTGVTISPSTTEVQGTIDALQQLDGVRLPSVNISGARSEVVRSVAIPVPPGVEFIGRDRATITVDIEPIWGRVRVDTSLGSEGLAAGQSARFSESNVSVVLEGSLPLLNRIVDELEAVVDLSGLSPGTHEVPVTIPLPEGIEITSLQPDNITVTISGS